MRISGWSVILINPGQGPGPASTLRVCWTKEVACRIGRFVTTPMKPCSQGLPMKPCSHVPAHDLPNIAAAKAVYREFPCIIDDSERQKSGFSTYSCFFNFLIRFLVPGGLGKWSWASGRRFDKVWAQTEPPRPRLSRFWWFLKVCSSPTWARARPGPGQARVGILSFFFRCFRLVFPMV